MLIKYITSIGRRIIDKLQRYHFTAFLIVITNDTNGNQLQRHCWHVFATKQKVFCHIFEIRLYYVILYISSIINLFHWIIYIVIILICRYIPRQSSLDKWLSFKRRWNLDVAEFWIRNHVQ
jgi:hypothetical protein